MDGIKIKVEDIGDGRGRRTDQSEVHRGPSSAGEEHLHANVHVGSHRVCVKEVKPRLEWKMIAHVSPLSNGVVEEGDANDGIRRIYQDTIASRRKHRKPSGNKRVSFPPTFQDGQSVSKQISWNG